MAKKKKDNIGFAIKNHNKGLLALGIIKPKTDKEILLGLLCALDHIDAIGKIGILRAYQWIMESKKKPEILSRLPLKVLKKYLKTGYITPEIRKSGTKEESVIGNLIYNYLATSEIVNPVKKFLDKKFLKIIESRQKELWQEINFLIELAKENENDWLKWLNEQREKNTMTVKEIALSEVAPPWGMQADGNYRREPEAFFNIIGAEIQANREVPAWSQPILKELGKGVVVLIRTKGKFLLVARQEPGNPSDKNYILLGPTIQASESNLQQKHGGKRPPYAELLDYHEVKFVELPQDGGRFYGKKNKYAVLTIGHEDAEQIVLLPNARWFNELEIQKAFLQGEINEHLTQALMLDVFRQYNIF